MIKCILLVMMFLKVELIYIVEILPPVAGKSGMVVEPGHNIGLVEPRQKDDIEGAQVCRAILVHTLGDFFMILPCIKCQCM